MTEQNHGRTTPEEPLTPDTVKRPSHAERARTLASVQTTGTLSTLDEDGTPYGSYITVAFHEGAPVILVSTLAEHTRNLLRDQKCSIMVHESVADDPLANGRVTLLGTATKLEGKGPEREAFLKTHPNASYYCDFKDFSFWKVSVTGVRYIGGYGRMSWVDVDAWNASDVDPLVSAERGIVDHMNEDHADALVAYARAYTRATEAEKVTLVSCDRYGFDMSVITEKGPRPARVAFDEPVSTGDEARKAFIVLLKRAREQLGIQK